ncbi:ankyrin repeat-containing protein [Talaromyces pinophilus]|uniref:Ankyrin repeat-containing protein n=1 Tax=Talaromyces pinophilus TaxID=128442 RepID=A0A0B8N4F8_TALPI|nr:ankyrin repeat-containing protein [Talaromyces pinophilus]
MSLLQLPPEIILLIAHYLSESNLARLLQVHRFLYNLLHPLLYQRHLQGETREEGLFRCTVAGNVAGVEHFLHYGANVNALMEVNYSRPSRRGDNADLQLWYKVKKPLVDVATTTTRKKVPPFRPQQGDDVQAWLIIAPNNPFWPYHGAQTPLNIAANMGNDALVSLLLRHGASVHGFLNGGQRILQPAAVDAIISGHESTVRLLLEHSTPFQDPNMDQGGLFLLDNGADICLANGHADHLEGDNGCLLDQAIQHGTIDTLRLLLDRGLEISPPKFFRHTIGRCTIDVVRLLLEHGYVPDIDTLASVVRLRRKDILQLFIDTGVDINMKNENGKTLLHTAILRCRQVQNGAVETTVIGCYWGRPQPLKRKLLRKIEPVPQQFSARCVNDDAERCTPEDIVRCLIRGDADLNAMTAQGHTPLALAENSAIPSSVLQLLVDSGAT